VEYLQILSQGYVEYHLFPIRDHQETDRFKLRYHFGPTVCLQSVALAATEAMVGIAYGGNDNNLYRLDSSGHIEFLGTEKDGVAANLVQPVRDLLDSLAHCLLSL
jgi:hypothetical protein